MTGRLSPPATAMLVIRRRAGRAEFTDEFVASPEMQAMQERISTALDAEIEAQGMDIIRSRIELVTRAGETHVQWADERYRGGPDNPMTDAELEEKVAACTDGVIDDEATARLIETAWRAEKLTDAADLARVIQH